MRRRETPGRAVFPQVKAGVRVPLAPLCDESGHRLHMSRVIGLAHPGREHRGVRHREATAPRNLVAAVTECLP